VGPHALIFVEGASDRVAVQTLATRLGRDLAAESVEVLELGGATNFGKRLREALDAGTDAGSDTGTGDGSGRRFAGLYDDAEERFFARGLERAGFGAVADRDRLARLGYFACVTDLEDELIRAVGEVGMLDVIAAQGELASFRLLQRQPVQRSWTRHHQLRRFLSARSGHKSRYARLLVEALDLRRVPRPLADVLDRV
jgi:hypothetical protein